MKIGLSPKYLLIYEIVALVITWNQVINGIIKYITNNKIVQIQHLTYLAIQNDKYSTIIYNAKQ